MKQSRVASLIESVGSTATGFVLALIAQAVFWPLLGFNISAAQNLAMTTIMTVLSILRGYGWRRVMEAMHIRHPISPFVAAVIAERRRQIEGEGWSAEHDDGHRAGELAAAGAAYAVYVSGAFELSKGPIPTCWPWSREWWKPTGFRRDLVKSCALIIAEGERHDRARQRPDAPPPTTPIATLKPRGPQAGATVAPSVDRSRRTMADGSPVTSDHRELRPDGQQKGYVVLSEAERARGFVRPVRRSYRHLKCGTVTTMGLPIAETYARDPHFYSGTFCCGCGAHFPVGMEGEFVWDGTDERVGT